MFGIGKGKKEETPPPVYEEQEVEPEGMYKCGLCGWVPISSGFHTHIGPIKQESEISNG
jgi:hypothetical protein